LVGNAIAAETLIITTGNFFKVSYKKK